MSKENEELKGIKPLLEERKERKGDDCNNPKWRVKLVKAKVIPSKYLNYADRILKCVWGEGHGLYEIELKKDSMINPKILMRAINERRTKRDFLLVSWIENDEIFVQNGIRNRVKLPS